MVYVALLGILPLALGAESSYEVGRKNLETAKKDIYLGEGKQWLSATPEEAQELAAKEGALYAPKIRCAFVPASSIGFEAHGMSQPDCGELFGKAFAPIDTHKGWKCEWAVAEGSGGRTVLAWCPFKFTLVATGEVVSSITMLKYDFDDTGLINGYHQEFDVSKLLEPVGESFALSGSSAYTMRPMLLLAVVMFALAVAGFMKLTWRKPESLLNNYQDLTA